MPPAAVEVPLLGGTANRGQVFRRGGTVRRPSPTNGAAIHALLGHLEKAGFDGAPRFLGRDDHGRDVLTYIPGEAVTAPYPAWSLTDAALCSVAQLLRRYHEAVADFDAAPYSWTKLPPTAYAGTVVCHNDPNLDNIIFREGRAVAMIDFDLASPGSPIWDVAAAVRLWSPLRGDEYITDARRGSSVARMRTFVRAYGATDVDPQRLISAVIENHDWLYGVVEEGAANGNAGFSDYWRDAHVRVAQTRRWYGAQKHDLIAALQQ
jgi:hypothetical protein